MRKVTQFFREQELLTNKFSTPKGVKIQASSLDLAYIRQS